MTDSAPPRTLFDFIDPAAVSQWSSIDDRIMGGCSMSRPTHLDGVGMRFHGTVSLDNNGGFASIRSANGEYDLSGCTELLVRLRGDGQRYKLSLRTDRYYDGVSYQTGFATAQGLWTEVALPFAACVATHHGQTLTTVAPLDPAGIVSFGLFIAERQTGPFQLDIAWIRAR
ncbi:MAG: CIA30 family protein [Desulfuromonadales bacterium]|nr:CIA30 family protein [Desulfuromonadales bacterium]